jgi:oligopeptide transport system permease protein
MFRFIARRLLQMVPVLFVIATLTFFMIRLAPGGPFDTERNTTPEIQQSLDRYYGFNLPIYRQYFRWLGNALHGDVGPSYLYANRTVNELIAESFPISAELALWSLLIALALGLTAASSLRCGQIVRLITLPARSPWWESPCPILCSARSSF